MPKGVFNRKTRELIAHDDITLVPLSNGMNAKIDNEDRHIVDGFNWKTIKSNGDSARLYAARNKLILIDGRKHWKVILLHRAIMNCQQGMTVDHINHDTLDNRRCNLRIGTHRQNRCNSNMYKNNTSGYKGVSWQRKNKRWNCYISVNNKTKMIGAFSKPEDAALAYDKAAREYHGKFASLNFPDKL